MASGVYLVVTVMTVMTVLFNLPKEVLLYSGEYFLL